MVRHKNRYIIIEIEPEDHYPNQSFKIQPASLHVAIQSMVQQLYGDFGLAATTQGFISKYCNEKTRIAVIRCRHGPHRFITSALPCIRFIESSRCKINTLYTGATIKKCFKFIQIYQQKKFNQFCVNLKTIDEKLALKREIMNLAAMQNIQ